MSLLMDALKKAEKARQAQAKREQAAAVGVLEDSGLSLDPLGEQSPGDSAVTGGAGESPAPRTADPREDSGGLSLESVEPAASGDESDDGPTEVDAVARGAGDSFLDDDTSATLPSIKAARASVDDYFDGTRSVSLSMEQVRSAMDDGDTAERHPAEPSGRHAARTVLDAAAARPPRRAARGIAYGVLALLILGSFGGGGYYYWRQMNASSQRFAQRPPPRGLAGAPSSTVSGVPAPVVSEPASSGVPARGATPVAAAPEVPLEEQGPALSEVLTPESAPAPAVPPRGDLSPKTVTPPAESVAPSAAPSLVATPSAQPAATAVGARPAKPAAATAQQAGASPAAAAEAAAATFGAPEAAADTLAQAIAKAGLNGPGAGIRVHRGKRVTRTAPGLIAAYQAFLRGDDAQAKRAYERILHRSPRNRDALLGIAAVALRTGHAEQAAANYRKVLTLDPSDSVASAALLQMQPDLDPVRGESYLKGLLVHEPGAAWLRFDLGTLYAEQGRWPQAEESYFAAYQADPENADYAYNLAVSLDHIEQRTSALSYYRRAIELADGRRVSFDPGAAMARVRTLTAVPGGE